MAVRLSPLNLALLLVTACALLFAAWSLSQGGESTRPMPPAPPLEAEFNAEAPRQVRDTRHVQPREQPARIQRESAAPEGVAAATVAKPTPSDAGDAVIQGVVLFAVGVPASGVSVYCRRSDFELDPPQMRGNDVEQFRREAEEYLRRTAAETRQTVSDAQGQFRFSGLDSSLSYDLHAETEAGGTGSLQRVAAGDSARILLAETGMIRGLVVGPQGEPVTEFSIRAWPFNRQQQAATRGFRSEDGRFSMPGSGRMQLEAGAEGYYMDGHIDVDATGDAPEVTITLQPGAAVGGIVRDTAGQPIGGALISLASDASNRQRWGQQSTGPRAHTDSKGRYRLTSLKPGETEIIATLGDRSAQQTASLAAGDNELDFTLNAGATVAIRLTDPAGEPVDAGSVWFQAGPRDWRQPHKLPARERGLVEYSGLNPGEYTLTVRVDGFPPIQHKASLTEGRTEIPLQVASGAMLSGTATSSSGVALRNANVLLRQGDEQGWSGWGSGRWARVSDDGSFQLGPVEPGQWTIVLTQQNRREPLYSSVTHLKEGTNRHDIQVDTGATLVVTVTDSAGSPIPRATVRVEGGTPGRGVTGADGVATITFLPPGAYQAYATASGQASRAAPLSLVNGENHIRLQMESPNSARITHVYPDTQASRVGLQTGDLVLEFNNRPITSWAVLSAEIRAARDQSEIQLVVDRGGARLTFIVSGGTVGIEGADAVR